MSDGTIITHVRSIVQMVARDGYRHELHFVLC